MEDYKGGVDYPVSYFYKELMVAYPNAKVLLNVRNPVAWYQSVTNTIGRVRKITESWPGSWFVPLMGRAELTKNVHGLSNQVPSCSSSGLGMMDACAAGEETAVQFYHDHVNEVKSPCSTWATVGLGGEGRLGPAMQVPWDPNSRPTLSTAE